MPAGQYVSVGEQSGARYLTTLTLIITVGVNDSINGNASHIVWEHCSEAANIGVRRIVLCLERISIRCAKDRAIAARRFQ